MSENDVQLTEDEYALALLAAQAGAAVGDILVSAGKGLVGILQQALKSHGEIRDAKAAEKERVIINKKLINLDSMAQRIKMECETNIAICHNNALVAQSAIQKGIITSEEEIAKIYNVSVSDLTLQSICMTDINRIKK